MPNWFELCMFAVAIFFGVVPYRFLIRKLQLVQSDPSISIVDTSLGAAVICSTGCIVVLLMIDIMARTKITAAADFQPMFRYYLAACVAAEVITSISSNLRHNRHPKRQT